MTQSDVTNRLPAGSCSSFDMQSLLEPVKSPRLDQLQPAARSGLTQQPAARSGLTFHKLPFFYFSSISSCFGAESAILVRLTVCVLEEMRKQVKL